MKFFVITQPKNALNLYFELSESKGRFLWCIVEGKGTNYGEVITSE